MGPGTHRRNPGIYLGPGTQDLYLGPGIHKRDPGLRTFTWDLIPGTHMWDPICGNLFMEDICGTNLRQPILFVRAHYFCIVLFLIYNLEVSQFLGLWKWFQINIIYKKTEEWYIEWQRVTTRLDSSSWFSKRIP